MKKKAGKRIQLLMGWDPGNWGDFKTGEYEKKREYCLYRLATIVSLSFWTATAEKYTRASQRKVCIKDN